MKMLHDTANDVHPPLYYVLLMLLFRIFGDYGWVYHLSAIIPYGILLIISCTLFYKEFGKETALLFNVFISFLTYSVFFNIEVRMYSLSAVELVMAFFGYYMIFKDSERISGYVIFTVSSIAAAYTHYYCIVSVSVFYLALLIMFLKKKMLLKRLLAVYVLTIASYLPWVVIGLSGSVKRTADNFWMTDIPSFQSTFLSIFSAGNLFYSLIMFITTLIAVTLLVVESVENSFLIPCVGSAIFSIIAGHIASAILGPVFQNKYIYAASILYILGLCIIISKFRMKTLYTAIILCATLILCIPSFRDTIATEKSKNSRISATLESIA